MNSFVCATRRDAVATTQFTSYESRSDFDLVETTKIWEAARATSAAPSFFDSIKIGRFHEEFSDGGTGANNPVRILWNQAQYCLKQGGSVKENLKCLVSIGTGIPSLKPFGDHFLKVAKTLQDISTETIKEESKFHDVPSRGPSKQLFKIWSACFSLTCGSWKPPGFDPSCRSLESRVVIKIDP